MWLFHHKYLADGTLSRYKARLVANGSTQLKRVDVDETFNLVVKPGTIRIVLSLAASRHWPIHQLDVKNAFLHGDLSEIVYMHQPTGFRDSVHPDYVFVVTPPYLSTDRGLLLLTCDYMLMILSLPLLLRFWLFLSQKKYVVEILNRVHMVNCNPSRTLIDTESKLGSDVQQVCLYMHDLWEPYLSALKRILRYVRGTLDYGLQLFSSSTTDLVAYLDADWAGCPTTRRSTFGYCVFLGNNLLSWSSKRQPTLSRSSAEAEYCGIANAVAETCRLRNLLREFHTPLSFDMLVYCDNFTDIFTKGLSSALFEEFRSSLSVWCPPAPTAEEC
ncbi:ribonuclease H-like domain-containing protein [Tanacetum coccineum]